jgi:hypothetical protein
MNRILARHAVSRHISSQVLRACSTVIKVLFFAFVAFEMSGAVVADENLTTSKDRIDTTAIGDGLCVHNHV